MSVARATEMGFVEGPGIDNTSAWNTMLTYSDLDEVCFDGKFYFKAPPNPITSPLKLTGHGVNSSGLIRDYEENSASLAPFVHAEASLVMEDLSITANVGVGGSAVKLAGIGASASVLRNLYITATETNSWAIPLILWSDDPLGIRGVRIDNVELFRAIVQGFWFVNVRGLTTTGLQYYPAGTDMDFPQMVQHATVQHNGELRSASIGLRTRHLPVLYVYGTDNLLLETVGDTTLIPSADCTNVRKDQ